MNLTTQTQTGKIPFQGLDAVTGLKEISDGEAAICNGGLQYRLEYFKCIDEQDNNSDGDEIYLKNGNDRFGPIREGVRAGETRSLNKIVNGGDLISLWENDVSPNRDDRIGSFRPNDNLDGTAELTGNGGKYIVGFSRV
jgi:hypothetical protein